LHNTCSVPFAASFYDKEFVSAFPSSPECH
jgi:hypothetical protein